MKFKQKNVGFEVWFVLSEGLTFVYWATETLFIRQNAQRRFALMRSSAYTYVVVVVVVVVVVGVSTK